ncbi:MAG: CNNM domain-containing protein [bacterium]
MDYLVSFLLVCFSALFSGLTLGLMSLDTYDLKRKIEIGDRDAEKIYSVRQKGNLLLCTLLLGNVGVNAALSIYLGSIASGLVAGAIATGLILIFGEILPQALFSRYAILFGARMVWLVKFFRFALYPITAPLAWVLDRFLGDEIPTIYTKRELIKLIEEHEDSTDSHVDEDEEKIVIGALSFSDKYVYEVMTPRTVVTAIEKSEILSDETIRKLKEVGKSRIPVYDQRIDNVIGILFLRNLIGVNYKDKPAEHFVETNVLFVNEEKKLDEVFNMFIASKQHLFIVVDEFGGMEGVISIEDILEEIIGTEIVDEFDKDADMRAVAEKRARDKNIIE